MKKILSAFLAAALFMGMLLPTAFAADSWEENADISGADLKIGIIGDSHVTSDSSILGWFQEALSAQNAIGGGTLDGLALTGDVIYQNKSDELIMDRYDSVIASLDTAGFGFGNGKAPYVYAMGNHEFPQNGNLSEEMLTSAIDLFETKTGQPVNYHTQINGYHFIAAGAKDYNGSFTQETENWMMQEIDNAIQADSSSDSAFDSVKPVFLLLHHPVDGTIFNDSSNKYSEVFENYLRTRPQVVNLTAHMHVAAQLPQTIWQDGFTAFQSPLTGGGYLSEYNTTSTGNISDVHQGAMLTVTDNVVKIYKLDYVSKEFIGDPWEIDIPEIVANKNDGDPSNDNEAYLYSDDKRENGNAPAFPAGAEVTAVPFGAGISITYPNSAQNKATGRQQDGFVSAYKVEVTTPDGTPVTALTYQSDFYRPVSERAESFTRTVSGLGYGSDFTINVYPVSPLGVLGEPISTTCTTPQQTIPADAIRYEFEDYYPDKSIVKDCLLSSGGKLVSSNQGGMLGNNNTIARTQDASFSFEINLAVGGYYNLEYTLGDHCNNLENVSIVTLSIDDTEIGTNDSSYVEDISVGKTYPWQYIPMRVYQKNNVLLSEGKHTVTLKIDPPSKTAQPNLFCADYLQFTPKAKLIDQNIIATIEFENYADDFVDVKPNVKTGSSQISGGSYVHFDTNSRTEPITLSLPVKVGTEGTYNFEYVASGGFSATELYLDDAERHFWKTAGGTALDTEQVGGLWPYFNQTYHQAYRYQFSTFLPEGEHTILLKLGTRPADGATDVCICMDYLKITPQGVTEINPSAKTRLEFEDFAGAFSIEQNDNTTYTAGVSSSDGCSNSTYMWIDSPDGKAVNDYESFTIPITVLQEGYYYFEYVDCKGVSPMKIYLDSTNGSCLNNGLATEEDATKNNDGKYAYFNSAWAIAVKHSGKVYLPAGSHNLVFQVEKRAGTGDFAAYLDYMEFRPVDRFEIKDGLATATVILDKNVTGKAILALYNGKELVSMDSADITDASQITVTAPANADVTHAKVFVWNDFNSCIPQTEVKTFTVQNK